MTFYIPKKALLMCATRLRPQDVFATSLYTGNGGTQTITNGLDLAGKGGLVWAKRRETALDHALADTVRGPQLSLASNTTAADFSNSTGLTAFLANGYTTGALNTMNANGGSYVSWAFRRAKKFFDTVTYTGNGVAGRQIPHGLGAVPGMIVIKCRDAASTWSVYHRSTGPNGLLSLESTNAFAGSASTWNNTAPTATDFTVGNNGAVNNAGATYVAYLFAHNPDLIDCGSYTGNGSATGPLIQCGAGWTPQWLMIKRVNAASDWGIFDAARLSFMNQASPGNILRANTADAQSGTNVVQQEGTGFRPMNVQATTNAAAPYVYMAIRVPT